MKQEQDEKNTFAALQKIAIIQVLWELPNYIWLLISGLFSKSMLVWMDLIDSTNIILREVFVLIFANKLKKNLSYQYNYGTGKMEAITSLCCDLCLLCGLVAMIGVAINGLFHPHQTTEMLIWVVILKIFNVSLDVYFLVKQKETKADGRLYHAAVASNLKNLLFDGALLVILVITHFLRDFQWSWYISPVFSIGFALVFCVYTVVRMRRAVLELMDATCDEQTQRNILKVLVGLYDYYDEFVEVKSRVNADQLLVDIYLRFRPETSYAEIKQFSQIAAKQLKELSPNCVISIIMRGDEVE